MPFTNVQLNIFKFDVVKKDFLDSNGFNKSLILYSFNPELKNIIWLLIKTSAFWKIHVYHSSKKV